MKTVINVDEKIGKTVGRRALEDSREYGAGLQRLANGEVLQISECEIVVERGEKSRDNLFALTD